MNSVYQIKEGQVIRSEIPANQFALIGWLKTSYPETWKTFRYVKTENGWLIKGNYSEIQVQLKVCSK